MSVKVPTKFIGQRSYCVLTAFAIVKEPFYANFGFENINEDHGGLSELFKSTLQLETTHQKVQSLCHENAQKRQLANYVLCIMNRHKMMCKPMSSLTLEQKTIIFNFLLERDTDGMFQYLHDFLMKYSLRPNPPPPAEEAVLRRSKTVVKSSHNTKHHCKTTKLNL